MLFLFQQICVGCYFAGTCFCFWCPGLNSPGPPQLPPAVLETEALSQLCRNRSSFTSGDVPIPSPSAAPGDRPTSHRLLPQGSKGGPFPPCSCIGRSQNHPRNRHCGAVHTTALLPPLSPCAGGFNKKQEPRLVTNPTRGTLPSSTGNLLNAPCCLSFSAIGFFFPPPLISQVSLIFFVLR